MKRRRRFKQVTSLEERLAKQAKECIERASKLPFGKERDVLSKRARQADVVAGFNMWINSPGLQPPE